MLSVIKKHCLAILAQKRISFHSPAWCSRARGRPLRGSMTVEACFVLPFFLFAFLNMISIIEIYRIQGNMSAAMHDTAKQMAVYGYGWRESGKGGAGVSGSYGLTWLYAAGSVESMLGKDQLDRSLIVGGSHGIRWGRSVVMGGDDCIDLVAEYHIAPPAAIIGYDELLFYNRMRTRAWTGYDNAANALGTGTEEAIVYMTPDGSVFHRSRGCTHLRSSITAVDVSFLADERNESGAKFYPCTGCGGSCGDTVYITDHGNRYHATLGCSSLKRTVLAVPISQAEGRAACSKCG